jgi:hypothetical protein
MEADIASAAATVSSALRVAVTGPRILAAVGLCSNHLPELWSGIRNNFAMLEDQRQDVLEHIS